MEFLQRLTLGGLSRCIIGFTLIAMGGDTLLFIRSKGGDIWADRGGGAIGYMARQYDFPPVAFAIICLIFGVAMLGYRFSWSLPYFIFTLPILAYCTHSIPPLVASDTIANAPAILYGGFYFLTLAMLIYGREIHLFNDD